MTTGQHPGAAPGAPGSPGAPAEVAGIASLAVRDLLHGPQQAGHVFAVVQGMLVVAFPGAPAGPWAPGAAAGCFRVVTRAPESVASPSPATGGFFL